MPAKTTKKTNNKSAASKTAKKTVKAVTKKKSVVKQATVKKATKKAVNKKTTKTPVKKASVTKKAAPKKVTNKKTVTKKASSKKIAAKATVKQSTKKTASPTVAKPKTKTPTTKGVKKIVMETVDYNKMKPSSAGLFGVEPYIMGDNEEYMNEAQRGHFKEILYRWKRELMEEVDKTVHHMKDGVMRHPDPSDSATQEEEFSLELRTRDRERKLIKKIDEALERIEQDDYGFCEACGIEIGIRRLEARPTAQMCIDCKTLAEIKEKQTRV